MRGVPVVGLSYCAVQGALVVGNNTCSTWLITTNLSPVLRTKYLVAILFARKMQSVLLLCSKVAMAGEEVKAAEKKWNPNVKASKR